MIFFIYFIVSEDQSLVPFSVRKQLVLEVHKFIRGVIKFDNLEQVQAQVQKDITEVRNLLDKIS